MHVHFRALRPSSATAAQGVGSTSRQKRRERLPPWFVPCARQSCAGIYIHTTHVSYYRGVGEDTHTHTHTQYIFTTTYSPDTMEVHTYVFTYEPYIYNSHDMTHTSHPPWREFVRCTRQSRAGTYIHTTFMSHTPMYSRMSHTFMYWHDIC